MWTMTKAKQLPSRTRKAHPLASPLGLPTVRDTRRRLVSGELSCRDVLQQHCNVISALNPELNALPSLCLERADAEARQLDKVLVAQRQGKTTAPVGPLTGMPYCAKDMFDTEGVRTTYGSPLFAGQIPTRDAEIVRRIRQSGALLLGKSNTPEFAAGSQTFNRVFGATRNPWNPQLTCGGSTGGGAVALATGMVILADGSDLAASLRNPASFCAVAGLRPSSHLEPRLQTGSSPFNTLSMVGPMARSVADLRELFLAIFDPSGCAPTRSLADWQAMRDAQAKARRSAQRQGRARKIRLGWSPNWGGLPVQDAVNGQMSACADQLSASGVTLVTAFPSLPDTREAFLTLRGLFFVAEFGDLYTHHRDALKDTIIWNIEQGLKLSASDIAKAERVRATTRACLEDFMRTHELDAIAGPTNQVLPFDLETPYIQEIDGHPLATYIDWLASNFIFSVAGLPAMSLPGGFARDPKTASMLPVGLQLVGRWSDDIALMDIAEIIEAHLSPLNAGFAPPNC